jgi:hypothetical protein
MRLMSSRIRSWDLLLVLLVSASPVPVLGGESPPYGPAVEAPTGNNAYCYSQTTTNGTLYYSPLLQTDADAKALQDAFAGYLAKQYKYAPVYGYRGHLTCVTGLAQAKAESIRQGHLNNMRALVNAVVETDWTYP